METFEFLQSDFMKLFGNSCLSSLFHPPSSFILPLPPPQPPSPPSETTTSGIKKSIASTHTSHFPLTVGKNTYCLLLLYVYTHIYIKIRIQSMSGCLFPSTTQPRKALSRQGHGGRQRRTWHYNPHSARRGTAGAARAGRRKAFWEM